VNGVRDQRYQGGLWAALFLILVLPVLFWGSAGGSPRLSLPVIGLKTAWPRAEEVWQYFGQAGEIPCWLGGLLTENQLIAGDTPAKIVAIGSDGSILWTEESPVPFKAVSTGDRLLLATDQGQVSSFQADRGVVWSEATMWPIQALALDSKGQAAVAQGPMLEGQVNLLERVRLYNLAGELQSEQLLRNSSALNLVPDAGNWLLSIVLLSSDTPQGQILRLTPGGSEAKVLWRSPDIIQALAVGTEGIAAGAGNRVHIMDRRDQTHDILLKNSVPDVSWVTNNMLAIVEAGDLPQAAAHIALISTRGDKIWRRRLKGPCRSLAIRGEEILAADPNIVYSFSLQGDINWCYESPTLLEGIYPLAEKKEVVVTTAGNHLLLLEPPDH
jgi:hypothetical protein